MPQCELRPRPARPQGRGRSASRRCRPSASTSPCSRRRRGTGRVIAARKSRQHSPRRQLTREHAAGRARCRASPTSPIVREHERVHARARPRSGEPSVTMPATRSGRRDRERAGEDAAAALADDRRRGRRSARPCPRGAPRAARRPPRSSRRWRGSRRGACGSRSGAASGSSSPSDAVAGQEARDQHDGAAVARGHAWPAAHGAAAQRGEPRARSAPRATAAGCGRAVRQAAERPLTRLPESLESHATHRLSRRRATATACHRLADTAGSSTPRSTLARVARTRVSTVSAQPSPAATDSGGRAREYASRPCAPPRSATARSSSRSTPIPSPEAGELLVRVRAAGLNGADMLQLQGRYPAPPGAPPDIPGLELAGEVVEVRRAASTRFEPGDRVMAIVGGGGQAELAVVHERAAMPVPDELDWAGRRRRARGLHHRPRRALHPGAACSAGERLLVHGAAGGVGIAAVQLGAMAGRARDRDRAQRARARADRRARRATRSRPRASRSTGPFDVDPRARRRARTCPATCRRSRRAAGIVRDRHRRRRQGRAQPAGADGQARHASTARRCAPARSRTRRRRARASSATCCRASPPATSASRWPRPSRSTRPRPPTSASRPAASSARSCSSV